MNPLSPFSLAAVVPAAVFLGGALSSPAAASAPLPLPALADTVRTPADTVRRNVNLRSALVVGQRQNKVDNATMGLNFLRPEQIRSIPTIMGEADLIKALQMQPGVAPGLEGLAGMMVRGGNDDQNLFLIDGNPIYQMNHFGGLFSAFNISAVRDVAFYKSSFPARYGGRLSSVVDVISQTGSPDGYHGNFGIGLTSANVSVGGPIVRGRTTFNVAMRRSWFDVLTVPALAIANADSKRNGEKNDGHYSFTDFNLRLNHRTASAGTFSLVGYLGQDNLGVSSEDWSVNAMPRDQNRSEIAAGMRWGNRLLAVKWQLPVGSDWMHSLTAAYTHYGSKSTFENENTVSVKTEDNYEHNFYKKTIVNGIDDWSLRSQWTWTPRNEFTLRTGVDYTYHIFSPEDRDTRTNQPGLQTEAPGRPKVYAHEVSAYGDAEWQPAEAWRVNAGLRVSDFAVSGKNYVEFEPRASVAYLFTPALSVKAAYSRMGQYVQQVSQSYLSLPTDYWMPVTDRHAPLVSDLVSAGAYYTYRNRWNVSIEGWYKHMSRLLDYREGLGQMSAGMAWSDKLTQGTGEAYGVDVLVEKNFGRWAGFLGYGLLWTDRHFPELNFGRSFPSKYDNRHKLNIAVSYRPSRRWELNAAWTYMTGSLITLAYESYPYTVPHGDAPSYPFTFDDQYLSYVRGKNNYRLPAFHRLDLGVNFYRFHKRSGKQSIWTLSVYNAYNRHNPMMVMRDTSDEGYRGHPRFRLISVLPIIPSVTYTLRF